MKALLTDNGREFAGPTEPPPCQQLLALHHIQHRTTRTRSPWTNGLNERTNRTLLDGQSRINDRAKWYESVEDIQADLDAFIDFYNLKRSDQG